MTAEPSKPSFFGYWSTLPAIFKGIAAVITAVGGLYIARGTMTPTVTTIPAENARLTEDSIPTPTTIVVAPDTVSPVRTVPGPTPTAMNPVDIPEVEWLTAELESSAVACSLGDQDACILVFDTLAGKCGEGVGESCDLLFELSPFESEYERYGATCGSRVGVESAGQCSSSLVMAREVPS